MIKTELYEIPYRLDLCYQKNKGLILPEAVPYIGMGASFIALQTFPFLGVRIFPEKADEYHHYLSRHRNSGTAVLVSQSGQSTETLNCARYFSSFIGIANQEDSPLCRHANCAEAVLLHSGHEERIVAKTYLNTLLVLYLGFGFELKEVLQLHKTHLLHFEQQGTELGTFIRKSQCGLRKRFLYVLGNGVDQSAAKLAALLLGGVLQSPVAAMSVAQFDHGFNMNAKNMALIALNPAGSEHKRTQDLLRLLRQNGAEVFELDDPMVEPVYSPLIFPMYFFFAAEYLASPFRVKSVFDLGRILTNQ